MRSAFGWHWLAVMSLLPRGQFHPARPARSAAGLRRVRPATAALLLGVLAITLPCATAASAATGTATGAPAPGDGDGDGEPGDASGAGQRQADPAPARLPWPADPLRPGEAGGLAGRPFADPGLPGAAGPQLSSWPFAGGFFAPGAQPEPEVPAGEWTRPVGSEYPVSAAYGRPGSWLAGYHTGVDFAVPVGVPVQSVGPGTVVVAGHFGAYGNAVVTRMEDGHHVLYAHLSEIAVRTDQEVAAGEPLGSSGNTGRSTGPHLHFEVRAGSDYGSDIDPLAYLRSHGVDIG
jgi:murein DD-endopeptidase MepM/ murein hydrolase activator NlpD